MYELYLITMIINCTLFKRNASFRRVWAHWEEKGIAQLQRF